MQQPMVVLDAECADDEVCSLANRNAQISQRAVIPSDSRREVDPAKRHDDILAQSSFDASGVGFVPSALENLEQDEVTDQKRFLRRRRFQFRGCLGLEAAQMRDPDGRVDENYGLSGLRPSRISSDSPTQPNPLGTANASTCLRIRTSNRRPSSTVALLVEKPAADMACDINSSSISMVVRTALHWSRPAGSRSGALLCIDRGRNLNAANCLPSCNALHGQRRSRRRRSRCPRLPNE